MCDLTSIGRSDARNEEGPEELFPGPSVVVECIDLGDCLETADSDADRIGLVQRNRSTDDLCDEVVAGSRDRIHWKTRCTVVRAVSGRRATA